MRRLTIMVALALSVTACAETIDSPDARDAVALTDGKADNLYGECEVEQALDFLNDAKTSEEDLVEGGMHARAARNLVSERNGEDKTAGTGDDVTFESLHEVDDVYYVGPVAMKQLIAMVSDRCVVEISDVDVIFSPQPYEKSHLATVISLLDEAKSTVDIAMYSLHDPRIVQALERAVDRGVHIRMIFEPAQSDRLDPVGSRSEQLERIGIDVRYVNKIMHHKFAIIDGPREVLSTRATDEGILTTGSGNWSLGAGTRYDENTVVVYGNGELNMRFQKEFNHLWEHSRDFSHSKEYDFVTSDPITDADIPNDPSVHAVFTSANFSTWHNSRWGAGFSVIRGENEVADTIVEHIENAEDSIWIASGHLRSRPISEALLAKAEADPELDIRVYLDGQEYVSEWAHRDELRKLEACIDKAGDDEAKQQDCQDKGYHFSYDLQEAGVPLRFKYYAYRWHYTYAEQMHHKYLIIDGETVISGSYNLSDNAEHNTMENMVIYEAAGFPDLVEGFKQNFLTIWDTGEGLYDDLMTRIETRTVVPIVFEPMALTWQEVRDLKSAISSNCPEVNSEDYRRNPQQHFVCYR